MDTSTGNTRAGEIKKWIFTSVRIIIGWHFLYEGIAKLFNPNWSSAGYLMESKWLFSGFFHWLISDSTALRIVDFLNIWGLLIIGLFLFLGLFTRAASISGAFLLILYYIANPPFMYSSVPSVSHFYIINYNLIEAAVLITLASLNRDSMYGLQKLIILYHKRRKDLKFPPGENHQLTESHALTRRELIKNLAVIPLFGGVFFGMARKRGWISFEEENLAARTDGFTGASLYLGKDYSIHELKGKVPSGRIKDREISRIIIGGNLISGFAHSRDLIYVSTWLRKYHTDEKVIETLWLCQAAGINTAIFRCDENTVRILKKFWSRGGKVQWLAQTYPQNEDLSNIKMAIDNGAIGAFIQGGIADSLVYENKTDLIGRSVDYIRERGLICGTAAHSLAVLEQCEANNIKPDFYMKTYHHMNYPSAEATPFDPSNPYLPELKGRPLSIWCMGDKPTSDFFRENSTPWIAFKVLAAGAIKPEEGFRHAFEGGADFACIGMFDFQVIENANMAYSLLNSGINRTRCWYA